MGCMIWIVHDKDHQEEGSQGIKIALHSQIGYLAHAKIRHRESSWGPKE